MPLSHRHYTIRRKVLKLFGGSFHILDPDSRVIGFSSQQAFRLREDIRIYADESRSHEILAIRARQIVDFSAAYDVEDVREHRKIGVARRKGWSSLVRDSWELLDELGQPAATLREDSLALALVRRFLAEFVPQHFSLEAPDGRPLATLRQRFNPFIYKLDVDLAPDSSLDPRLALAVGVLIAAIEGRQG